MNAVCLMCSATVRCHKAPWAPSTYLFNEHPSAWADQVRGIESLCLFGGQDVTIYGRDWSYAS